VGIGEEAADGPGVPDLDLTLALVPGVVIVGGVHTAGATAAGARTLADKSRHRVFPRKAHGPLPPSGVRGAPINEHDEIDD
jgi:hypothetical protein